MTNMEQDADFQAALSRIANYRPQLGDWEKFTAPAYVERDWETDEPDTRTGDNYEHHASRAD
jgi:hypothetical protein